MAKKKTEKAEKKSPFVPVEEQPYQVPGNWRWVTVESINHYSGGSVDPATMPDDTFELYSVPSSANDFPEIVTGVEIGSSKQTVMEGDVLLCKINPRINRVWMVSMYTENILLASSEWIVVRNEQIDSRYLMYCFRSHFFREYMLSNVSGVGGSLMRAQPKFVKGYPVPVAPLAEQQRIVARIESLFAKLDEAKGKAQEALESFEARKVSILRKAFSGELTKQWRIDHSISASEWNRIQLKECGDWFGGGTPTTSKTEYWANGNILWITSKDMKCDNITDTQLHITKEGVENSTAVYCDKPAVLFVMRSGILRRIFPVCMVSVPFTVNQDLKAVIPNDKICQRYLFWACTAYEKDIREKCMKSGTTVESIETKKFFTYSIPLAPIKEQAELVRILDSFFAKESEAKAKVEATLESIDTMKKSILAKAFRGELGTNNPEDESAEELLKRTLA